MMNIVIEDKITVKTLNVGDLVVYKEVLHVVTEDRDSKYVYAIDRVDRVKVNSVIAGETLKELTERVLEYGGVIYNQVDYELVIRRKQ